LPASYATAGSIYGDACWLTQLRKDRPGENGKASADAREVAMSSKRAASETLGPEIVLGPRDSLVGMLSIEGNLRV
jgi:hypothetical protein